MEPYIKYVARAGGLGAKIVGVLLTIYGIKEIWFRKESKLLSTPFKINLTLLYLAHMGAVSLAIAVLFGYGIVSLPVAAAIVSATALIKNVFDLVKDNLHLYKLRKELKTQQRLLATQYETFNTHLALFNKQNQNYFAKAYDYIAGKLSSFVELCKKINFSKASSQQENLENLKEISTQLEAHRGSSLENVDSLANDLAQIINTSKKIIDLQNDMLLMDYDINSKRYIIQFSGVTASLTLLLCFPFNWVALPFLNPFMLVIGIGSALTSMWGIYQKHLVEDKILAVENKEIHHLIESSVATVDKLNKAQARKELNQKLDTIVEEFDKNKPNRSRVIPVIFSDKIPTIAKTASEVPLSDYIKEKRDIATSQESKSWWRFTASF